MKLRSVFCVLPTRLLAERTAGELVESGLGIDEISLLFLIPESAPLTAEPESSELFALAVPLDVPGIGRLAVAGLIAAAMKGKTVVSLADGLLDFGVPDVETKQYEEAIRGGGFLVAVHSSNGDKTDQARTLCLAAGATLVRTLSTVTTPRTYYLNPPPRKSSFRRSKPA
ncbi:MAG: hypothetical protein U1F61_02095 [Opitutaceae bacterium]